MVPGLWLDVTSGRHPRGVSKVIFSTRTLFPHPPGPPATPTPVAAVAGTAGAARSTSTAGRAGVAGLAASTAAEGALYNVMINLDGIDDETFNEEIAGKAVQLNTDVREIVSKIREIMYTQLKIKEI